MSLRQLLCIGLLGLLAACSPRLDWREIREPALGYTVLLPGKPLRASRELKLTDLPVRMDMTSVGQGGALFAVGVAALPPAASATPAATEQTLARFAEGLRRNVDALAAPQEPEPPARFAASFAGSRNVRAETALHVRGQVAGPNGPRAVHLYARLVVADDRLYQVVALGSDAELPPLATDTFFQSFRLTP